MSGNCHSGVLTFKQPTFAYVNTMYSSAASVHSVKAHVAISVNQFLCVCFSMYIEPLDFAF